MIAMSRNVITTTTAMIAMVYANPSDTPMIPILCFRYQTMPPVHGMRLSSGDEHYQARTPFYQTE